MVYLHPIVGATAVALLVWLATQGLRSRHAKAYAAGARARHRRFSKLALVLVLTAATLGTASVHFLRPELRVSGSLHFWLGWAMAGLLLALAGTGPRIHEDPDSRRIHPPTGVLAVALAVLTAALGMGLLP